MNIEELLRTSSVDIAAGVVPPDVEPTTIRDLARRRTRLRSATIGSAVVAVTLVAALVVVRPGDRDTEPAPTPTPNPLRVDSVPVWGDSEGVHVGDRTYPLADGARLETLAVTANGVVYADRSRRIWFQPRLGDAEEIGRAVRYSLAAGPASTKAVWVERREDRVQELVVFDTRRLEEVGRATPPGGLQTGDGATNGPHVGNQGPFFHVSDDRVIFSGSGADAAAWTYRIEDQTFEPLTRRHRPAPGRVRQRSYIDHAPGVSAFLLNLIPRDPADPTLITFADDAGREISSLPGTDRTGVFNATGARFATVVHLSRERTHVEVVDAASGRSRRLTEDSRLYPVVGWGRGEILMVWLIWNEGPREDDQVLACDVRRATCRTLPTVGRPVVPNS